MTETTKRPRHLEPRSTAWAAVYAPRGYRIARLVGRHGRLEESAETFATLEAAERAAARANVGRRTR